MGLSGKLGEAIGVLTSIQEASLSRIWQHHKDRAFVILTAWRGDRSEVENEEALKGLQRQIRGAGFGYIPIEGVGQEKISGKISQAVEPSLLVPNKVKGPDDGSFVRLALGWARAPGGDSKAKQDYIFYATPNDKGGTDAAVLKGSGGTEFKLKKFSPNTMGDFFSRLRSGRTFKYEWIGVKYGDPVSNWIEGMGREGTGQIMFNLCETLDEWCVEFGV